MDGSKGLLAPLTGVAFLALLIGGFLVMGDSPDPTKESAEAAREYFADNEGRVFAGSILTGLGAVFLLFFAGWLRRLLRDAEGPGGMLSAVAFAGAIVLAVGIAAGGAITISMAEIADNVDDPVVFQTLNALSWSFWLPFAVGVITFLVAAGISILRHGALPAWLGWGAIVAGVLMFSPAFIVAAPLAGLWVLVVSILGASAPRQGSQPTT